jgi:hypothetical protein
VPTRPAFVEFAPVRQLAGGVEEEEVGCAGRPERFCHLLRLIEHEREIPAQFVRQPLHVLGRILRVADPIVGVDGDDSHATRQVVRRQSRDAVDHVLHEGAVVADEHDQEGGTVRVVIGGDHTSVHRVFERKRGHPRSQRQHRR